MGKYTLSTLLFLSSPPYPIRIAYGALLYALEYLCLS